MITFVRGDGTEFQLPSGPEFGAALWKLMQESDFFRVSPEFMEKIGSEYDKTFGPKRKVGRGGY